ncbi:4-alpha-glucanotransferase [Rhodocaloribacter litoris]|uniref:4-alpha-glucanotransferase n=1 Tax=Rhodocaloribacter litoris TaxID=2558931 RepID=UPI00142030B5|nr:4-alpha-glucanotransferase [Rhodocaloribacter litoris]QXD14615.1 4-alpha-glucanotransferase [Rhodocaloribacter litoris]
MQLTRSSGLLLHITSLPGPYGIGDFGPAAYQFADFLVQTGQRIWQVLPLVPVGYGFSPYAGLSTFALNPLLISPERLREQGLLNTDDLTGLPAFPAGRVDFDRVIPVKTALLRRAFGRFEAGAGLLDPAHFEAFCARHAAWLDDFALFMTLKEVHGEQVWTAWDPALAHRRPEALARARQAYATEIRMHRFWQFLAHEQWQALKAYCNERGIRIMGDLPIYVAHDSADVWANPHLFALDAHGNPTVVAGVPPDYFSKTGQRWGNPLYRWDVMAENGYAWWTRRMHKILSEVDLVRLDHFRGFEAYWEVPASEETAVNGRWVKGPGADLFETLRHELGELPVVAENLGVITDEVTALMDRFGFPGMAILQFGFDGDADADFLPHNYRHHLVAYTGTHDNDTVVGWWHETKSTQDAAAVERAHRYCRLYLDLDARREREIHWAFIRALFASVAGFAIVPLQDVLGLGSEARMNTPGQEQGNWTWRFTPEQLTRPIADRLRLLTELYGRSVNKTPVLDEVAA